MPYRSLLTGIILAALVAGCTHYSEPPQFVTVDEVGLRSGQSDEASVKAILPKGTVVVPAGQVGSEGQSWKVDTPYGAGWLYNRYVELHANDLEP